jgi:peptidoglycan/xylan/chitin deacetylase (PgdA/CDA1 family)
MHVNNVVALCLATLPAVIEAHAGFPLPNLFGRRSVKDLAELRKRDSMLKRHAHTEKRRAAANAMPQPQPEPKPANIKGRANTSGQCGAGFGSCAAGYCCSSAGWCGLGSDYCTAPDCQINYGTGCDDLQMPPGPKTSGVARTKVGSVPYGGVGIYDCTTPGVVAITYDDGPFIYTSHILDLHQKYGAPATFFITGNNLGKGPIDDSAYPWPGMIQRMDSLGYQVASHTYGHQDLGLITQTQRYNQMYYNEMAFNNILGKFPTYMRPPYSDCTGQCETDLAALGYHIVYFDLDTEDYLLDAPNLIQQAKNDFNGNISTTSSATGNWLSISHDIHFETAYNLTEYMITTLLSKGYKPVTVGTCLGDPPANWYRTLGGGATFSSGVFTGTTAVPASLSTTTSPTGAPTTTSTAKTHSPDGTCGGTNGYTCVNSAFGICCSAAGFCGNTQAHCQTGCQTAFSSGCGAYGPISPGASPDGTCGGANGYTCVNSAFGICCSAAGYCGNTQAHCQAGCQKTFSSGCGAYGPIGSGASPDGSCGGTNGYTCVNSAFGICCSPAGYCGNTHPYCGPGCQTAFSSGCGDIVSLFFI